LELPDVHSVLNKNTFSPFLTPTNLEMIQKFKQNILDGKIGNFVTGEPYPRKTIKQIFLAFSLFLKWKFDGDEGVLLAKPLTVNIKIEKKDPNFLTIDEILILYKHCSTARQRYLIANIFSSGQRAKEFHNNRYSDMTLPEKQESFVRLFVRKEFSKTHERKIPLFFKKSLEASREFLKVRENAGIKPDEPIMDYSYDAMRRWLKRFGKKILNKDINYQLFRSSCAKWLVDVHHYNRYQLCYFMGWDYSTPMADIYIKRSDAVLQNSVDNVKATEMEELEGKVEKQDYKMKIQNEKFNDMQSDLEKTKLHGKLQSKRIERQIEEVVSRIFRTFDLVVIWLSCEFFFFNFR
jgi:integrase